jgi:hypothetical protein
MKKGLTLIELLIMITVFVALTSVATYIFRAVLLAWEYREALTGGEIMLNRGMEEMVRTLRGATDVDLLYSDELRFTTEESGLVSYYAYYFYNANDAPYPPDLDEETYILRKAQLQNVVGGDLKTGTLSYGSGKIVMTDVLPPPTSELSYSADMATIDLSIEIGSGTAIRSKTAVTPRNL